ncbi:MAG: type II secretion system protein [Patescibacteria group bacterium]
MRSSSGFTLIELLVVVAILGILSSVVLGSLNTARDRAQDAAVRSNLSSVRSQAQLYHEANGNSYNGLCDNTGAVGGVDTVYTLISAAVFVTGGSTIGTGPTTLTDGTCNATPDDWATEVALKTEGFYCIDSMGNATTSDTSFLGAGELICE